MQKPSFFLTKTDFIHYLHCPKSFWLAKRKKEHYPEGEVSAFLLQIAEEGYEVERYAQALFPQGVLLPSGERAQEETEKALKEKQNVLFQPTIQTKRGLFARIDILKRHEDDTYSLYEVKSSTSIKKGKTHSHYKDACFQSIALKEYGVPLRDTFIIYVNKHYIFKGELLPNEFLIQQNITKEVTALEEELQAEITCALSLLQQDTIDEHRCPCYRKTRSNHCDAFAYFNGIKKPQTVWELCRISEKKLNTLIERDVLYLKDIPEDIELNEQQQKQVEAAKKNTPIIQTHEVKAFLQTLTFPLYFFDYETATTAVPRILGMRPWQQIPFQFSLHILNEDGVLRHAEYIATTLTETKDVVQAVTKEIGETGTIISWHASFEKTRNNEMALLYPEQRDALENINKRMFDLEEVFKKAYHDAQFCGSTSIKKVLPILCPNLSYTQLNVKDGTQAMQQWHTLITIENEQEKERIKADLSEYCKLDTFAMVELYRELCRKVE